MHFPIYSYTFTRISDSLDLHIKICGYLLLIRYWERITGVLRSQGSLLLDHLFSVFSVSFLFYCFHDSMHWTLACSLPLFICYHVWIFICGIAVMLIYHNDYITCSGYFRLNVYAWGIFLAYISRRLSSRLRFHVF